MPRDEGRIFFLAAEAAARFRLNHSNFFGRETKQGDQRFVHIVRTLQRTPDGYTVRRIGRCDHALIFDVELLLRPGPVFALDDDVRLRPCGVHVASFEVIFLENIVVAIKDGAFREGILDRKNRGQRFHVDVHRAARLFE